MWQLSWNQLHELAADLSGITSGSAGRGMGPPRAPRAMRPRRSVTASPLRCGPRQEGRLAESFQTRATCGSCSLWPYCSRRGALCRCPIRGAAVPGGGQVPTLGDRSPPPRAAPVCPRPPPRRPPRVPVTTKENIAGWKLQEGRHGNTAAGFHQKPVFQLKKMLQSPLCSLGQNRMGMKMSRAKERSDHVLPCRGHQPDPAVPADTAHRGLHSGSSLRQSCRCPSWVGNAGGTGWEMRTGWRRGWTPQQIPIPFLHEAWRAEDVPLCHVQQHLPFHPARRRRHEGTPGFVPTRDPTDSPLALRNS